MKGMDLVQAEQVMDEIHSEQPKLLASVLVQQNMGNTLEQIEVLLNILIVTHLALKYSGVKIRTITEADQEKQLSRYVGHLKFAEGLGEKSKSEAMKQYSDQCSEKLLMAYVTNEMVSAGFTKLTNESGKYLVMTGINIVNCIAHATRA